MGHSSVLYPKIQSIWQISQCSFMIIKTSYMLIYSCRSVVFSLGDPVLLDGRGWVGQWESSDTYSTRWKQGTLAGRRRREMCAGAGSPPHRRRSGSRRRSLTGPRRVAGGARARWLALCCCGEPPRSCCSGRAPRRPSSCRSTRAWGLICRLCPQRTWEGVEDSVNTWKWVAVKWSWTGRRPDIL